MFDDKSFEIRLGNASGIPIVRFGGAVSKHAISAIQFMLDRLAKAGHYHVVLNVERAHALSIEFLTALSDSVANIKKHYGEVELVAGSERIRQLLETGTAASLFRLSKSESEAIRRIKQLAYLPGNVPETTARLSEKL